jgi:pimeloyl-ACP methyl ester carboxylesterase
MNPPPHDVRDDTSPGRISRRAAIGGAATALAVSALYQPFTISAQEGTPMSQATPVATSTPTVVLVHGAFADSSSWTGVVQRLQAAGIPVLAPANPLRGLVLDTAYTASFVSAIPGPVLLVGHSYGGAVITNVASQVDNAVGLVYIAAYTPDEGETLQDIAANFPTEIGTALQQATVSATGDPASTEVEFSIARESFVSVFAADLPAETTSVMWATQRPLAALAFTDETVNPAWKNLPSWSVIATADNAIGADAERFFAERAGSIAVEVDASHVVMISQPQAVTDLITSALATLR